MRELDAVQALGTLFKQMPVERWHAYFEYQYLSANADVLPAAFDAERFDFYGHILNGQPQQRERWKRAVAALNRGLGEVTGQLYVQKYFPPEAKQKVLALVENLRGLFDAHPTTALDVGRDQKGRAWRNSRHSVRKSAIRTSGEIIRLCRCAGRCFWQQAPGPSVRMASPVGASRQAHGSRRVAHDAANDQRLLQPDIQ